MTTVEAFFSTFYCNRIGISVEQRRLRIGLHARGHNPLPNRATNHQGKLTVSKLGSLYHQCCSAYFCCESLQWNQTLVLHVTVSCALLLQQLYWPSLTLFVLMEWGISVNGKNRGIKIGKLLP